MSRQAERLRQRRFKKFVRERRTPGGRFVGDIAIIRGNTLDPVMVLLSEEGRMIIGVIGQWLRMSAEAPAGKGPLCLACEQQFSAAVMPADFSCIGLQAAVSGSGPHLCLTGICARCAQKGDEELLEIAFQRFSSSCAPGGLYRLPDAPGRH